jgi:hypothetical protein
LLDSGGYEIWDGGYWIKEDMRYGMEITELKRI